jgi:hypothetical protein
MFFFPSHHCWDLPIQKAICSGLSTRLLAVTIARYSIHELIGIYVQTWIICTPVRTILYRQRWLRPHAGRGLVCELSNWRICLPVEQSDRRNGNRLNQNKVRELISPKTEQSCSKKELITGSWWGLGEGHLRLVSIAACVKLFVSSCPFFRCNIIWSSWQFAEDALINRHRSRE